MITRCTASQWEAGFTLLEMLVVLVIVALVAGVSLPLLGQPSDGVRLQSAAVELVGALRATRATAILRNGEAVLTIDVEQRRFSSPAIPPRSLPDDVSAQLKFAAVEREER